ncbi:ABC transporter permease [Pradoshia sp.]
MMAMFGAMLWKEWLELKRSYKLIIVPFAFAIIMVTLPITMKLLPALIEQDLPEGTVIVVPESTASDIVGGIYANFEQLGLIVLILVMMGTVASEREKGSASLVLSKPIGRGGYIMAKWLSYSMLSVISFLFGMALTLYYTRILFDGKMEWGAIAQGTLLYLVLILLCVTLTLLFSAIMRSAIFAGFLGLGSYLALTKLGQYLPDAIEKYTPSAFLDSTAKIMLGQEGGILAPLLVLLVLVAVSLFLSIMLFKRQEL